MANDLTLTPKPTSPGSVSLSTPAQNGGSLSSNAVVPTDFAQAPPGRQTATVDNFQGATPGVGPTSIPWGSIAGNILAQIDLQSEFATKAGLAVVNAHLADFANPHAVSKAQVGLALADNTSDASKPVSAAQAAAIAAAVTGPLPGATITASQISDAVTDPGRQVLTAPNDAAARTALGSGAFGDSLFTAATLQDAQTALAMSAQPSFRNLVINGKMEANQYSNVVSSGTVANVVDMWTALQAAASTWSAQVINAAGLSEFPNFLRITSGAANAVAAGSYWLFNNVVEGANIGQLNWGAANARPVVLSFLARSTLAGTYSAALRNAAGTQSYVVPFTLAANVWTKVAATIPGPTAGVWLTSNGQGINLAFCWGIGTTFAGSGLSWLGGNFFGLTGQTNALATNGAICDLAGVQIEPGVVATPFEHRHYQAEIAMCQRYYWVATKLVGVTLGTSTGIGRMGCNTPVIMRTNPMLSISGSPNIYDGAATSTFASLGTNYSSNNLIETDVVAANPVFNTVGRVALTYSGGGSTGIAADARF